MLKTWLQVEPSRWQGSAGMSKRRRGGNDQTFLWKSTWDVSSYESERVNLIPEDAHVWSQLRHAEDEAIGCSHETPVPTNFSREASLLLSRYLSSTLKSIKAESSANIEVEGEFYSLACQRLAELHAFDGHGRHISTWNHFRSLLLN